MTPMHVFELIVEYGVAVFGGIVIASFSVIFIVGLIMGIFFE